MTKHYLKPPRKSGSTNHTDLASFGTVNEPSGSQYNKFWEKLITYFPYTVTLASDTATRNKTLVRMHIEVNKTKQFGRLQCWYY
jgi:hypothetical protein